MPEGRSLARPELPCVTLPLRAHTITPKNHGGVGPMTEAALINRLTTEIRELKPLLQQHLVDQDGDMQPYVLMADVARWAHEGSTQMPDRVSQLMRLLEREYASGE